MGGFDRLHEFCGLQHFLSGSYVMAWSWVMVAVSISYLMDDQASMRRFHMWTIGNGDAVVGPRSTLALLVWIVGLFVVAFSLAKLCERAPHQWIVTLTAAVTFFPAPIFTELLINHVDSHAGSHSSNGLRDIVMCWIVASVVHLMPNGPKKYEKLVVIMRTSTGFALGVAWNCWIRDFKLSLVGQTLCLVALGFIAARLTAPPPNKENDCLSLTRRRHSELVATNLKVMCAVALRDWLGMAMGRTCFGLLSSLLIVILLSALLSAMVSRANLEDAEREIRAHESDMNPMVLRLLACLPCFWIMYPWLPLGLLAGRHSSKVKDRWGAQIAHTFAITFSLVAINVIEISVQTMAGGFGWCAPSSCPSPDKAIVLEVFVAVATTFGALFLVTPFAPSLEEAEETVQQPKVRLLNGF